MINILVMTHGKMAEGISDSAQMILGPQERFEYLSFRPDWSLEKLVAELKGKLAGFGNDDATLVMVDLFGGTPSNSIATLMGEGYQVAAVAGVNLPMLIEALMSRDDAADSLALAASVCEAGSEGIVDIAKLLLED